MSKYHNLLPTSFNNFFTPTKTIHSYNTRAATNELYYIPRVRTNYGIFNIRFNGPKMWNSVEEHVKQLSFNSFKDKMKDYYITSY